MLTLITFLLYPLAIQYERGGNWRVLYPITLFTAILDVAANYTELALLTWDWPRTGETTFSQRLERLQESGNWNLVIRYLNYFDPSGQHITPLKTVAAA